MSLEVAAAEPGMTLEVEAQMYPALLHHNKYICTTQQLPTQYSQWHHGREGGKGVIAPPPKFW